MYKFFKLHFQISQLIYYISLLINTLIFLSTAPPQDDSSSEETQGSSSNAKPIVPPRPRNLAFDHKNKVINSPNVVKTRGVLEAVEFADLDSNGDRKLCLI